jgi:dipeptidyl aminopeptidase/acylaminoacyl peptidase
MRSDWRTRCTVARPLAVRVGRKSRTCGFAVVQSFFAVEYASWMIGDTTTTSLGIPASGFDHDWWVSADGKSLYAVVDSGGDELGHLHRFGSDGDDTSNLTPELRPYAIRGGDAAYDGTVVFSAANRDGFSIICVDPHGESRSVYVTPNEAWYPHVSPDARRLCVDTTDHDPGSRRWGVTVFDTLSGEKTAVLVRRDGGSANAVCFAPRPNDPRILVSVTTPGTGTVRPAIWNTDDDDVRLLSSNIPDDTDLVPLDWSEDGRFVLLGLERRAVARLLLHDLSADNVVELDLPKGSYWARLIRTSMFGEDASVLAAHESFQQPLSLLQVRPEASSRVVLPSPSVPPGHDLESVEFKSADGTNVQAWYGCPSGAGPWPAVVHVHGGPHLHVTDAFNPWAQSWIDSGFAYLDVNYRGSSGRGSPFMQEIWGDVGSRELADIAAAREWLIANAAAHPDRVFLTGESYGGFLTLYALARQPMLWAGGMVTAGIADWEGVYRDSMPAFQAACRVWFQGPPDERRELYRDRSPATWAGELRAPLLVEQALNDSRTPPQQMRTYADRLRSLGKALSIYWLEGGHGFPSAEAVVASQERRISFAEQVVASSRVHP